MPAWGWAGFWGFVAGSALVLGAAVGFLVPVRRQAASRASWAAVVVRAANAADAHGASSRQRDRPDDSSSVGGRRCIEAL
jgi:zinc transporter, ZIP family